MLAAAEQAEDEGHCFAAITLDERRLVPMQDLATPDLTCSAVSKREGRRVKAGRWQRRE
jgi:hypothetical protein